MCFKKKKKKQASEKEGWPISSQSLPQEKSAR